MSLLFEKFSVDLTQLPLSFFQIGLLSALESTQWSGIAKFAWEWSGSRQVRSLSFWWIYNPRLMLLFQHRFKLNCFNLENEIQNFVRVSSKKNYEFKLAQQGFFLAWVIFIFVNYSPFYLTLLNTRTINLPMSFTATNWKL